MFKYMTLISPTIQLYGCVDFYISKKTDMFVSVVAITPVHWQR